MEGIPFPLGGAPFSLVASEDAMVVGYSGTAACWAETSSRARAEGASDRDKMALFTMVRLESKPRKRERDGEESSPLVLQQPDQK
jgi:hypothetical protein